VHAAAEVTLQNMRPSAPKMMRLDWTTMTVPLPKGLFVLLACAVLGVSPRAEASPFLLNLQDSGSSGSGRAGSFEGSGGIPRLELSLGRRHFSGPVPDGLGLRVKPDATTWSPATTTGLLASFLASAKSAVGATHASAAAVRLDLGDGAYLSVSSSVGESLINALAPAPSSSSGLSASSGPSTPPNLSTSPGLSTSSSLSTSPSLSTSSSVLTTNQDSLNSIAPSLPATEAVVNDVSSMNDVSNEIVRTTIADISSSIISSAAENTNRVPGGGFGAADDPIHTPEPATLILLASALAFTAQRLRRRRP